MSKKQQIILLIICILIFGAVGIYLTFFAGNTSKYDGRAKAYEIYPNETSNSDGISYSPIYYFRYNGHDYECASKGGSSFSPDSNKNTVYFDSKNPNNCLTEYDKSSSMPFGIICLVVTAFIIFLAVKKPSSNNKSVESNTIDYEKQKKIEENVQTAALVANKIGLIVKRVFIGIFILIILVITIFDIILLRQTIAAKDYIDAKAYLKEVKQDSDSEVFDDYIYTFNDYNNIEQEIIISYSKEDRPEEEVDIKYDENNPQEYYKDTSLLDRTGIILFVLKIVLLIALVIIFFNKKLLSKVHIC